MVEQTFLDVYHNYSDIDAYLQENLVKKILLVCGASISRLKVNGYFESLEKRTGIKVVRFSNFRPNPLYESVVDGINVFHQECCDGIVAVGGGSAMDVAKCIKLYSNMPASENYLKQNIIPNDIPFLVLPTTSGTGSEATRFAVIYYDGKKQSVSDNSCIPSAVIMDASTLTTLSEYQKKVTMLDAFCHAIESFWSVNSTEESRGYSRIALQMIMKNCNAYLENEMIANKNMLLAANFSGKAINIAQTTAGHAMCYKLTHLYGIAHGHAAALCLSKLWPYMLEHMERCIDPRGGDYLNGVFEEIAKAMECKSAIKAVERFMGFLKVLNLSKPTPNKGDFEVLQNSLDPVRLKNNPIHLDVQIINGLYHEILIKE